LAGGLAVIISVSNFPMSAEFVSKWASIADHISVWFDLPYAAGGNGSPEIKQECLAVLNSLLIPHKVIQSKERWTLTNYREMLLRSLDDVQPDIVIHPDSDECFDEFFLAELEEFKSRRELLLYMDYIMVTEPNYSTFKMPKKTHCKVFKWMPNMSFAIKYLGRATPRYLDIKPVPKWNNNSYQATKSKIQHYVHYNQELFKYHMEQKIERKQRGFT